MSQDRPEEVERQLEEDRAQIDRTLEALQSRLSPGQLLDQAMTYMRSSGGEVGSTLVNSAKQNPFPLILTSVGLAWLMATTSSSQNGQAQRGDGQRGDGRGHAAQKEAIERARAAGASVTRAAEETEEAFQSRVAEAKARALAMKREAEESTESFKQRVEEYLHRAEEAVSDLGDRARHSWDSGKHAASEQARSFRANADDAQVRVREWYTSEPLLAGAIGIAAGTVIAALVPATRQEKRLLGSYGDSMREQAADVASRAVEHGKSAAAESSRAAVRAAEDTAREAVGSPNPGDKSKPGGEAAKPGRGSQGPSG